MGRMPARAGGVCYNLLMFTDNTNYTKGGRVDYTLFASLCKGCGLCLEVCPEKILTWDTGHTGIYATPIPDITDTEKCTACLKCQNVCPDAAILIIKNRKRPNVAGAPPDGVRQFM